jgi:hypothetical protein
MTKVTLDISKEFYEFAKAQAELFGYCDTRDYLNGMLNMALLSARNEFEEHGPLRLSSEPCEAERDFLKELEEDEGGAMRHKDEDGGDLD